MLNSYKKQGQKPTQGQAISQEFVSARIHLNFPFFPNRNQKEKKFTQKVDLNCRTRSFSANVADLFIKKDYCIKTYYMKWRILAINAIAY